MVVPPSPVIKWCDRESQSFSFVPFQFSLSIVVALGHDFLARRSHQDRVLVLRGEASLDVTQGRVRINPAGVAQLLKGHVYQNRAKLELTLR